MVSVFVRMGTEGIQLDFVFLSSVQTINNMTQLLNPVFTNVPEIKSGMEFSVSVRVVINGTKLNVCQPANNTKREFLESVFVLMVTGQLQVDVSSFQFNVHQGKRETKIMFVLIFAHCLTNTGWMEHVYVKMGTKETSTIIASVVVA